MMNDFTMPSDRAAHRSLQVPLADRLISSEVSGDFTLPDYQPEIKRLLRIGVGILPPLCGERVGEINGHMDYYVLYMGHDNALWCAPLTTEYRLEFPTEEGRGALAEAGEPFVSFADVTTETPVGRVTAPRRLSIRCRVNAHVRLYGEYLSGGDMGDVSDGDTEVLTGTREINRLFRGLSEMLPLQDDIILPPTEQGEWRVVCAEGTVMVTEASPASTEGVVNCRGEVFVKLTLCPTDPLFANESGDEAPVRPSGTPLTVLQRKIPFTQAVDVEGVTSTCTATACGYCTDLSVQMEEGQAHLELGVITEVRAQKNEVVTYTKDLYSTRREGESRHALYPTERALRAFNGNFTLSDSLPLSEAGMETNTRVVDVTAVATPEVLSTDSERGRCVLTGTCRAQLLLDHDGEYTAGTLTLPFRYEFDSGDMPLDDAAPGFDGSVTVLTCRARADAERVALDAELAVSLCTRAPSPLTALAEATFGEPVSRRRGEYVICFPAPTDTLWSVAKRYHAPIAALTAANNLPAGTSADSTESLDTVGYLIV